jgi:type II secretory pathway pseudopilin PulG
MKHPVNPRGFTLIELILAFSLSIVIAFVSVAGFVQFNSIQKVNNAASEVTAMLQKAKSHAISQVKPVSVAACVNNPLDGYEVRFCGLPGSQCTGTGQYNLYILCGGSTLVESATIPGGVTLANGTTTSFTFRVLNGSATPGTITLSGSGKTKTIQVTSIGIISAN